MDVVAIIVFFLTLADALDNQLEGPQNTVSVVGSNVTLRCSSPSRSCNDTEWLKYGASGSLITVFRDRLIIYSAYRDRYSVDNSSGCDLVIKYVQLTDAGRFICRAFISSNTVEKSAYLIIQETQPNCTITASLNEIAEGDRITLKCEVGYCGPKKASMLWKDVTNTAETQPNYSMNSSQSNTVEEESMRLICTVRNSTIKNVTPLATEKGSAIRRSYYVTASAPEVQSFACITSFALDEAIKNLTHFATNIPNSTCATSFIKVLYSVRNVALSPPRSHYAPGSVINCTAQGHPAPTFKWQEMEVDGIWTDIENLNGSEFTMTNVSTNQYRCVARNVVNSTSYNATSLEFFVNNRDSDTTTLSFPDTTTLPLHLILMASVAGGLFLLIILLIVCFSVRSCLGFACCHPGEKTKDKISEVQPLTESPDICIYSVVNKVQNSPPKAKPSSHPNMKSPQGASPQALPRTGNPKTDHTTAYQHEEVTYADLAMELGPRQAAPKYNQPPQETLYAAVGTA